MSIYRLKFCEHSEINLLLDFIEKYWQKDHIFTKSKELLHFQHFDVVKDRFNFILAHNTITGEVDGIIGLIPVGQYDTSLLRFKETWGGIWKVRSDVENNEIPMLGMLLFQSFRKFTTHGSIGMSAIAKKLHLAMRYKLGTLNHYYLLNNNIKEYRIASIPCAKVVKIESHHYSDCSLKVIDDIKQIPEGLISSTYRPIKSLVYLHNRFQVHPIFKYSFIGIYDTNQVLVTILVTRKIKILDSCLIRIVDVFGPLDGLASLKAPLTRMLIEHNAEYIDILNHGIPSEVFEKLGFDLLDPDGELIIPNYFEPFLRKNVVLDVAYRSPDSYVIYKADSDQDRPSQLDD